MSTGYWWNGTSYSRSSEDAREDQELRLRFRDPANWRDLPFLTIAPLTAGLAAAIPSAGVVTAVFLGQPVIRTLGTWV